MEGAHDPFFDRCVLESISHLGHVPGSTMFAHTRVLQCLFEPPHRKRRRVSRTALGPSENHQGNALYPLGQKGGVLILPVCLEVLDSLWSHEHDLDSRYAPSDCSAHGGRRARRRFSFPALHGTSDERDLVQRRVHHGGEKNESHPSSRTVPCIRSHRNGLALFEAPVFQVCHRFDLVLSNGHVQVPLPCELRDGPRGRAL
mmetsp:Transcript_20176/g.51505  ORF Transcript_20176/g.51505 Transcript_20176/m.51505 type:complete len:201 (+) Transcript_20176:460-1062(+)